MIEHRTRRISSDIFRAPHPFQREQSDEAIDVFAFFRNSSEELFATRAIGDGAAELHQSPPEACRVTSQELFNSWLSNTCESRGAAALQHNQGPHGNNEPAFARQELDCSPSAEDASRSQQNHSPLKPPRTSISNQGAELPPQKLNWFQQNYPMTRSRSSELRRRYLAMQQQQQTSTETSATIGLGELNQLNQLHSNPVSTVVGMLKGTLERKRLSFLQCKQQKQALEDDLTRNGVQLPTMSPSESSAAGSASEGMSLQQNGSAGEMQASSKRRALEESTKKRRVERKRMMTEAKERTMSAAELQATAKRCESLEKEIRSLKMNLAFMNRKDSEQTKRIEELEKQNQELQREKEELLEEVDTFLSSRSVQ